MQVEQKQIPDATASLIVKLMQLAKQCGEQRAWAPYLAQVKIHSDEVRPYIGSEEHSEHFKEIQASVWGKSN